jgi:hypothetical protein
MTDPVKTAIRGDLDEFGKGKMVGRSLMIPGPIVCRSDKGKRYQPLPIARRDELWRKEQKSNRS